MREINRFALAALAAAIAVPALAQDAPPPAAANDAEKLAQQLANPISSLISVPFQFNWNTGGGANSNGDQFVLNVQPVIPFSISDKMNLISRTIVPFITQTNITPPRNPGESTGQTGIGDITQSLWLSPKAPIGGWLILGVGPALLLPTSTSEALGNNKFAVGPTVVALTQSKGFTIGVLVNQLWSLTDSNTGQNNVNSMFIQPFLAYANKTGRTYGINTETTCNWNAEGTQCAVPINISASQLVKFGRQPVQFGLGARYYVVRPDGTPQWGMRFTTTFLFPAG